MSKTEVKVAKVVGLKALSEDTPLVHKVTESMGELKGMSVELNDGSSFALLEEDPRYEVWVEFLDAESRSGDQVYVEVDSDERIIREVFPTYLRFVEGIHKSEDDERYEVTLLPSPSARFLDPARLDFRELFTKLEAARGSKRRILVAINPYTREILDVREPEDPGAPLEALNGPVTADSKITFDVLLLELTPAAITLAEAFDTFDFLASQPSIPFQYIDDCCASRAHLMCDLMSQRGIQSRKIWNYGRGYTNGKKYTLVGSHEDDPGIQVRWLYHVAPVVSVLQQDGGPRLMVLDPSVFNRPRFFETWRAHQKDNGATRDFSNNNVYFLSPFGERLFDNGLNETRRELRKHFYQLKRLLNPTP